MATIAVDTYLDWWTARTAGEARTINSGAKFTIRTDSRRHANSPASMTGSLWSQTINEWEIIYDGTDVRWLPIDSWSGTCAIWTTITQWWVSGYFLWYWASLTSAPSTTIWATWFLKFREITWGNFIAWALTGITANATWPDVAWWIEVVADDASTITVPRLGKFSTRWDWFYLTNTNGAIAQQIQIPTNGWGAGTYCPWVWVETAPASDLYEYRPELNWDTNWRRRDHIGWAYTETDARQNFVKGIGSWLIQFWETSDIGHTYANTPSQVSTYAGIAHSCTYTWEADIVTVSYSTGHLLKTWHIVWADFTSGWATADANYTITVLDAYTYTFPLAWSGTAWNVTIRPWLTITFTAHTLGVWDMVYCDFTTGSWVDWNYEIYAVTSANAYLVKYPAIVSITSWAVTTHSRYSIKMTWAIATDYQRLIAWNRVYLDFTSWAGTDWLYTVIYPAALSAQASTYTWATNVVTVTFTAHGKKVWDSVFVDFTSWGGTPDWVYTIVSIVSANAYTFALTGSGTAGNATCYPASFDVVANNWAAGDSWNVTVKQVIGNVPASWCKVRIPNVILRWCATGTRANNLVNAVLVTRPEFATTTAWAIDMEYAYSTWYNNFAQPYSVRLKYCSYYDSMQLTECATALDIEDTHASMYGALDAITFNCASNFSGGTVKDCKFQRGNIPWSTDHAVSRQYCVWTIFENVTAGIIQFNRSTGYWIYPSYNINITMKNCHSINSILSFTTCSWVKIQNHDHSDRYIWYSQLSIYALIIWAGNSNILVNWLTFWFGWTIPNVQPMGWIAYITNSLNCTLRNCWTFASPLAGWAWRPNYYAMASAYVTWGNNNNIRIQRVYVDDNIRTWLLTTTNSDKNIIFESVQWARYVMSAMAIFSLLNTGLNSEMRWMRTWVANIIGQASVYGTHFLDLFYGSFQWRFILQMNEPTVETADQFTMVSGTQKFTSAWRILMGVVWDQAIWEDNIFRIWHTGFQNITPLMSWGTIGNYTLEFDIDLWSGYSDTWTILTGANLAALTVNPVIGYKMKIRVTTTTANTTAITNIIIYTTTTDAAQWANLYPLDYATVSFTGLTAGSRVQLYDTTNSLELYNKVVTETSLTYAVPYVSDINCRVRIMYTSATTANVFEEFTETLWINGISRNITPTVDSIYVVNGLDWSAVTGIIINDWALLIETDEGTYSRWQIYAYETYWLFTEEWIRDEGRFIRAIDQANYELTDFKIKNVSSPSIPLVIDWWYGFDSVTWEAIDIIDTSGWTIFTAPDRVVAFSTSGTVVISWDVQDILDPLAIVNGWVQKASKLIPYNTNI